ncbi:glycerate kinase [Muriicola soli]|uniref:Glycerate kinase n=1 Tax=Muriicola soli TaxID=2507538 RepID=A0A411E8I1_9FLAO|nr:glycerate kinase [Muriicola soli]QBA63834.1 glycerate kinase [Muriicola soli]
MKKIVIAPDKFKGSLTGLEFCEAAETGLRQVFNEVEIIKAPLADGGDGTIEVVRYYLNADTVEVTVNDPLFRPIKATYLFSKSSGTAYIEMAEASGLKVLKDHERNCMQTTTLGTGQLLADALGKGAKEIILGIGGSATNDAGMGMATALGFKFLDKEGDILSPVGANLIQVATIDTADVLPQLKDLVVRVACDVTNPLYGPNGAARIYAAQKGASEGEIDQLDEGLKRFARFLEKDFNIDVQQIAGAGAAGGMGAAAVVFLNAELSSGIELVKDLANFEEMITGADWIITGEGKLDEQTLSGKAVKGVLESAKRESIPVAAFCGIIEVSASTAEKLGLSYTVSVSSNMPNLEIALKRSYENVVKAAADFAHKLNNT